MYLSTFDVIKDKILEKTICLKCFYGAGICGSLPAEVCEFEVD